MPSRSLIDHISPLVRRLGTVVAALAVGLLLSLGALPAAAQTTVPCYPPSIGCGGGTTTTSTSNPGRPPRRPQGGSSVSASAVVAGQAITVHADAGRFAPGTTGIIVFDCNSSNPRQIGTFTVAADGSVTQQVSIPLDAEPGPHEICIVGTGADGQPLTLVNSVTVHASGRRTDTARSAGLLSRTGGLLIIPASLAGLALVAVGLLVKTGTDRFEGRARRRPRPGRLN